jgi:hypothetical protein
MKLIKFTFFLIAIIFSLSAGAREAVPIINYSNLPIATSSGKPLQPDDVKKAIVVAAAAKDWTVAYQTDGKLLATLVVRNKHTIVVEIAYDSEKYSINYKDSINMKYGISAGQREGFKMGDSGGQAVIHPFYNKWVQELKDGIRNELIKL